MLISVSVLKFKRANESTREINPSSTLNSASSCYQQWSHELSQTNNEKIWYLFSVREKVVLIFDIVVVERGRLDDFGHFAGHVMNTHICWSPARVAVPAQSCRPCSELPPLLRVTAPTQSPAHSRGHPTPPSSLPVDSFINFVLLELFLVRFPH